MTIICTEMTETFAVASMAELIFKGVRSLGSLPPDLTTPSTNFACLAGVCLAACLLLN